MSDEKNIHITVTGLDSQQVQDWILERLSEQLEESVKAKLEKMAETAVELRTCELVDKLAHERIQKDIDAVLAEGWQKTDSWGNPMGKVTTLRERVRGFLDAKEDDYHRTTRVEKWLAESVKGALADALKVELEDAKKRLRESFDEVIKAKLHETLRTALGVK